MTQTWPEKYRPPADERTISDRTEPIRIDVRTHWLYSDSHDALTPPGVHWHGFARGGRVVRSDVKPIVGDSEVDHLHRAIEAFGDDADLVVEVRRRETTT